MESQSADNSIESGECLNQYANIEQSSNLAVISASENSSMEDLTQSYIQVTNSQE